MVSLLLQYRDTASKYSAGSVSKIKIYPNILEGYIHAATALATMVTPSPNSVNKGFTS
jgi:hypothetical protein